MSNRKREHSSLRTLTPTRFVKTGGGESRQLEQVGYATVIQPRACHPGSNFVLEILKSLQAFADAVTAKTVHPGKRLSSVKVIAYCHDLRHGELANCMSESERRASPVCHRARQAIRADLLISFTGMTMGKYPSRSLRLIRQELWRVHEAPTRDERSGEGHVLRTDVGISETIGSMPLRQRAVAGSYGKC